MSKLCTFLTEGAHVKSIISDFCIMIEIHTQAHVDPEISYFQKYRVYIVARGVLQNQNFRSLAPRLRVAFTHLSVT